MRGGNDHLSKDNIDGNSDDQVDLAILMLYIIIIFIVQYFKSFTISILLSFEGGKF